MDRNIVIVNIKNAKEADKFFSTDSVIQRQNYQVHFIYYGRDVPFRDINSKLSNCGYVHDFTLLNAGKYKNLYKVITDHFDVVDDERYFFADPDLGIDVGTINSLFSYSRKHDIDLCQPSLTLDSKCSHRNLITQDAGLREVPFVEIMCPMFSGKALKKNIWTFDLSYSNYGIDYIWGENENCHVIDDIPVKHAEHPHYEKTSQEWGFSCPKREFEFVKKYFLPADHFSQ